MEGAQFVGLGVALAAWLWGVTTAKGDAEAWNRRHGITLTSTASQSGSGVGLSIAF